MTTARPGERPAIPGSATLLFAYLFTSPKTWTGRCRSQKTARCAPIRASDGPISTPRNRVASPPRRGTPEAADRAERGRRAEVLATVTYDDLLSTRLAYGTPEVVSARLKALGEQLGLSGVIIEPNVGGLVPSEHVP